MKKARSATTETATALGTGSEGEGRVEASAMDRGGQWQSAVYGWSGLGGNGSGSARRDEPLRSAGHTVMYRTPGGYSRREPESLSVGGRATNDK